jgi:hypothetical protein
MQPDREDSSGLRQEMIRLLHTQMQALNVPRGLSDTELRDCYRRHERVCELRDMLTQADAMTESAA